MRGTYQVKVSRRRGASYKFTVRRNLTIVRGDSGTGKTTLYEMIADYTRLGDRSGVAVQCDRPCVALTDIDWRNQLKGFSESIVFVDEGLEEIATDDFAAAVRDSNNFYVIFSRAELPNLPYSVNEVYRIATSGKFHSFEPLYKEGEHHRYSLSRAKPKRDFDVLLTEDSKSGFQFFDASLGGTGVRCETAQTNSGILTWLFGHESESTFVVADGAAFGPYADRVLKLQKRRPDQVTVCLPESFEWLLLRSGVVKGDGIAEMLANPGDYIESAEFFSWERFFFERLKDVTKGTAFAYQKDKIPDAFFVDANASKVMSLIACRNIE